MAFPRLNALTFWLLLFGALFRSVTEIPGFTFAGTYLDDLEARGAAARIRHLPETPPLYPDMTDAQQELVISELLQAFEAG
jgi:hypothetical protein